MHIEDQKFLTLLELLPKTLFSSMIDVSDGLLQDLGHIATASEVHIDIKTTALIPEQEILDVAAALKC
jgi:thiamine monophosphate kinase